MEHLIAGRNPGCCREAAQLVGEVRDFFAKLSEADEWRRYIMEDFTRDGS